MAGFGLYFCVAIAAAEHGEVSELAEGARLEIVYAPKAYPGFESLPLRHFLLLRILLIPKLSLLSCAGDVVA